MTDDLTTVADEDAIKGIEAALGRFCKLATWMLSTVTGVSLLVPGGGSLDLKLFKVPAAGASVAVFLVLGAAYFEAWRLLELIRRHLATISEGSSERVMNKIRLYSGPLNPFSEVHAHGKNHLLDNLGLVWLMLLWWLGVYAAAKHFPSGGIGGQIATIAVAAVYVFLGGFAFRSLAELIGSVNERSYRHKFWFAVFGVAIGMTPVMMRIVPVLLAPDTSALTKVFLWVLVVGIGWVVTLTITSLMIRHLGVRS